VKPVELPREIKPPEHKIARRPPPAPKKPAPAPVPQPEPPGPMTAADAAHAASEHAAAVRARAEMAEAAASAARAESAKPPAAAKLFMISDPLGASVTASWSGKSASGLTPIVFRVRRGAPVTVTFSKPGYAPEVRQLTAAETQVVDVELRQQK
jgi:hypothetical protein